MKLHIENSIVIENNGRKTTLGEGEYEFDSASEFIKFIEGFGEQSKEPLIKDEKVRKAVREWAEANDVSRVSCDSCVAHKKYMLRFSATELFNEPIIELYSASEESLWDDEYHTIAELCGEEEG